MKKVLFLSHYAGRTGAPIVLLGLLRWLKANTDVPFETVHLYGGALLNEFTRLAPTAVCTTTRLERNLNRVSSLFGLDFDLFGRSCRRAVRELRTADIGLVYSNTISNGEALAAFSSLGCPVITHVHELEGIIRNLGSRNMELVKKYTTRYIAVSEQVKKNLVDAHGIPADSIDVVYPAIDISPAPAVQNVQSLRNAIPEDAFIVCSSGQGNSLIKGKDIFIQLASVVKQSSPDMPVHFMWVGGADSGLDAYLLERDIVCAGIADIFHRVPFVENPLDYYNLCDVFVLASREDSFPLACLEAASLGKPIMCFDKGGGMHEFVGNDAGFVISYLNINAMAEKIIELARDPALKVRLGEKAAGKVLQRHSTAAACPVIFEQIKRFLQ